MIGVMMITPCFANRVGVELQKDVNGGYQLGVPVVVDMQARLPFLPKAYVKGNPIFTAPRGDATKMNHSRFDATLGGGITLFGGQLEFETGATYWWAGNDQGIPEQLEWTNAARYYWEF